MTGPSATSPQPDEIGRRIDSGAERDDTKPGAPPRSSADLHTGTAVRRPEPSHPAERR
ncbi:hypothetical protein [Streptomyces decoyicus]|uniref:hypothetical protein n=1 Tax=Streptomyces decoyicus TaxID=249567 RepID=UPI00386B6329